MAKQIAAIPLSQLQEVEKPDNFYIFGSEELPNGALDSRKYKLEKLMEYAKNLQFERRISLTMERDAHTMFIGEEMTIYKVEVHNISELKINGQKIQTGKDIQVKINPKTLVTFEVSRISTDPVGYIFIYAKATLS
ncbi:MAG: hypothetical protein ACK5KT_11425 [Dysgonomonas sp.]